MTPKSRWWWIGGAVVVSVAFVVSAMAKESGAAAFLTATAWIWLAASLCILTWWLWRWMTYRVGVRLFITYFLVGVFPILFAAAFAAVGLYILMGQYTSVRLGSELNRVDVDLSHQCQLVLQRAEIEGEAAAESLLEQVAEGLHEPFPRIFWQADLAGQTIRLGSGHDLPFVTWNDDDRLGVNAVYDDRAFSVVTATSASGDRITALIPMDEESALAVSGAWWFDVAFLLQGIETAADMSERQSDDLELSAGTSAGMNISLSGGQVRPDELWPKWEGTDSGWLSRPYVVWFRVAVDPVDLATGAPLEDGNLVALLRTSPANVWNDFTSSRYELGKELWGVIGVLAATFLVGYGIALTAAATVVFSIARSTARLTSGARAVERGDLDYRVPVKRRDQLGDLARTFNHMTNSVQSMLADVAEKERLARELELARRIQESLLPASHLEVGPVTVRATFKPAAEVGGDYFDVFSLAKDRLLVAIGDVAGHGLSTGLLMASLKSSVAALVHEGYGGTDLITKVNHLLLAHGHGRTLVTLSVVEIDLQKEMMRLTNAGHCPAYLIASDGPPEELLVGSLPMGSRLCRPATLKRPFPAESRVVLYSDGLVEGVSPAGEPFGYGRLEAVLSASPDRSSSGLTAAMIDALAEHTNGVRAADDLTILIVERT